MKRRLLMIASLLAFVFILASCGSNTFTVTFDSNQGSAVAAITDVKKGDKISKPSDPTRTGFDFKGWYKEVALTTEWIFTVDVVEKDITLYAKWQEKAVVPTKVTVTFNLGYTGATAPTTVEINQGAKATKPADPTRDDFAFLGWFKEGSATAFDFNQAVSANLVLTAKWETTKEVYIVTLDLNYDSEIKTINGVEGEVLEIDKPKRSGYVFLGWKLDGVAVDLSKLIVSSPITLVAQWVEGSEEMGIPISTPQELLDLFSSGGNEKYWLTNDIDFTCYEFKGSKSSFSGTLDGNNHKISNFHVDAPSKQGAFFGTLAENGVVKNMIIANSSIKGEGEATGFISSFAHGKTQFENLTFINVTLIGATSYTGILFADNAKSTSSDTITISNITVVNNDENYVQAKTYAGGLVGYIREKQEISLTNIYMISNVYAQEGNNTAGAIIGRVNKAEAKITLDNIYYEGKISGNNYVGGLIGEANVKAEINLKNILFNHTTITGGGGTVELLVARRASDLVVSTENIYYTDSVKVFSNTDKVVQFTLNETTQIELTETWFNASTLDKEFFGYGTDRLEHKVELGVEEIDGIVVGRNSYDPIFVKDVDIELNLDNLLVYLTYNTGQMELLEQGSYTINSDSFNKNVTGDYEIIFTKDNLETKIIISVVEISELIAYTYDQKLVFKVGDNITAETFDDITFNAVLTNDKRILIENGITFDLSNIESKAGDYQVQVDYKDTYVATIEITIIDSYLTALENQVEIQVDKDVAISGSLIESTMTVRTLKEAFTILEESKFNKDVIKKVYIKDGTYFEKVTLKIPNVHLIGESQNNTIIDYNMANGSLTPTLGTYGTQNASSFTVNSSAEGFIAYNLTFSNSFDYYGSEITNKQAPAIVVQADKSIFHKVSFKGLQDTLYAKDGRQWYLDVYVEGIVDYIFGNGGPAFFENSVINTLERIGTNSNAVIAAPKGVAKDGNQVLKYGYVFYNNVLTVPDGSTTGFDLGRPWGQNAAVAYINNQFDKNVSVNGWVAMSPNKPEDAQFMEYNNKIGETIYNSTVGTQLTAPEALLYSDKDVVFGTKNGQYTFETTWDYQAQLDFIVNPV